MAEKTLNTRIALKYDSLENWLGSSLVLKKGEIAIAEIPAGTGDSGLTPPAIGIKVGDGKKTFSQLGWIQAIAGDVNAWAKAANKPSYNATEISAEKATGDGKTVASRLSDLESATSAAEVYRILKDESAEKWYLQSKAGDAADTAYTTVSTIDLTTILAGKQDNLTFDGTYNASTNKVATVSTVTGAINGLSGNITGAAGAGKTLKSLSESNGIVSAEFQDIAVTLSQVTDAGTAAAKGVATAIADNDTSTDLPTAAAVASYVDTKTAGLTGAMHFKGVKDSVPASGTGYESGDVIAVNKKEYVYDADQGKFIELGDEGSYALNTVKVSAGNGLTGGGDLTADRSIAHAVPTGAGTSNNITAAAGKFVNAIAFDDFGHVTAVSTGDATTYSFAEGAKNGAFQVTPAGGSAQSVDIHGLNNAAYKDVAAAIAASDDGLATGAQVYNYVDGALSDLNGSATATTADGDQVSVLTGVSQSNGKISKASEVKLAAIAKTGNVNDLIQTSGDVLVLDCGTSTTVI